MPTDKPFALSLALAASPATWPLTPRLRHHYKEFRPHVYKFYLTQIGTNFGPPRHHWGRPLGKFVVPLLSSLFLAMMMLLQRQGLCRLMPVLLLLSPPTIPTIDNRTASVIVTVIESRHWRRTQIPVLLLLVLSSLLTPTIDTCTALVILTVIESRHRRRTRCVRVRSNIYDT